MTAGGMLRAVQALSFGSPLGPWIQLALVASILVVAGVVLARRLGPKAGAALAALGRRRAGDHPASGQRSHARCSTDREGGKEMATDAKQIAEGPPTA